MAFADRATEIYDDNKQTLVKERIAEAAQELDDETDRFVFVWKLVP